MAQGGVGGLPESSMVDVLRTLDIYDSRLDRIESEQRSQKSMLIGAVRELIALRKATNAALNHRFLVDDS